MELRQSGRRFLWSMLAVAMVLFGIGWFTSARGAMNAFMVMWLSIAFFPFIIIAAGLAIMMLCLIPCIILAAISDTAVEPVVDDAGLVSAGFEIMPGYYRMLARIKHPAVWGGIAGVLVAALALWGLIALIIVPREAQTAEALLSAQAQIDAHYVEHRSYPEPTTGGTLTLDANAGPLLDGFDRPLRYQRNGEGRLASYTVHSHGYDGVEGNGDDFCISGATRLARWADRLQAASDIVRLNGKSLPFRERLHAVQELRCKNGTQPSID